MGRKSRASSIPEGTTGRVADSLTRNQRLVLGALEQAGKPLSAYAILDELRSEGLRAPLQIYRALDALTGRGDVHRLESLNAFVACTHPACMHQPVIAFAICDDCQQVEEITDAGLATRIREVSSQARFKLTKSTVELRGQCPDCTPA
jgi:Fur family zinc uptake transcriptional regulator